MSRKKQGSSREGGVSRSFRLPACGTADRPKPNSVPGEAKTPSTIILLWLTNSAELVKSVTAVGDIDTVVIHRNRLRKTIVGAPVSAKHGSEQKRRRGKYDNVERMKLGLRQ